MSMLAMLRQAQMPIPTCLTNCPTTPSRAAVNAYHDDAGTAVEKPQDAEIERS
jgi:hypothetical protein